jgi:hypothetical protein
MDKHKIGPKEAADTIRDDFHNEHADPRFLHQVRFAKDVLTELKEDKSVENVAKVMRLLDKAGIEGHAYHDYPAWVTNERGETAVVNDEDHEKQFMERPPATDEGGVPNPEHGHVDKQTGVFTAGVKPAVYDHDEPFAEQHDDPLLPEHDPVPHPLAPANPAPAQGLS